MIPDLPEQTYIKNFINELREDIKWQMRAHDAQDLLAIDMGRDLEKEIKDEFLSRDRNCIIQPISGDPRPMGYMQLNSRPLGYPPPNKTIESNPNCESGYPPS